jgi:hypothetical protein
MPSLTQAQEDALARIYKEMHEHFDGAVIGVMCNVEDGTDTAKEAVRFYWTGGRMLALGLATEAAQVVRESFQYEDVGSGEEEDGN